MFYDLATSEAMICVAASGTRLALAMLPLSPTKRHSVLLAQQPPRLIGDGSHQIMRQFPGSSA
ncbi:hypothetical protein EBO15_20820 [Actinomadura harenae]|uniref:Uncharacterized protein n=1 Tax=Actinomadura harenae TaxID=2483351 RepID=A0A3M2LY86_9ACTN|nr:hypothetical protein EBO15_20820 [Actinomadura harenae]